LDREGEAIAWHLKEALGVSDDRARRVIFNAITKTEIQRAFADPKSIDMDRVNAQQARRILDRIVGYEICAAACWTEGRQGLESPAACRAWPVRLSCGAASGRSRRCVPRGVLEDRRTSPPTPSDTTCTQLGAKWHDFLS
jgi:hypothetical protein